MTQQQAACRMQLDVALSRFHAALMSMQLRQARRYPEVHPGAGCLEQMQAAVEPCAGSQGREVYST